MNSARKTAARARRWPVQALLGFIVLVLVVFGLVFFTGPKTPVPKLGIDLQGGTRVTLVPQGERPTGDQLDQARRILEDRVNGMGVSGADVVTDGDTLVITVPGEDSSQAKALGRTSQLLFRPVVSQGGPQPTKNFGSTLVSTADRWVSAGIITPDDANKKLGDMAGQMEQMGLPKPEGPLTVHATAPKEPGNSIEEQEQRDKQADVMKTDRQSDDPDTLFASAALLTCGPSDPLAGADDPRKPLVACGDQGPQLLAPVPLLKGETDEQNGRRLTGDLVENDSVQGGLNPQTGQVEITFKFKTGGDNPGGETWADIGQKNLGNAIAITLDSHIISAPQIREATPAGSTTQITGDFSEKEAQDLANNLRYGALPLSFTGENGEQGGTAQTISPTMGLASLRAGLIAGIVGLVLVALYALAYYRGLGVVALLSLVASGVLIYGTLVLLGRWIGYSLDLAGIAGLIIGVGTTADSFVVYFERIKDEIHQGSTFRSAVPRAWKRASSTVVTGNMVSLVAAVVLYFLAIGEVKGFAFTLGLTTFFDIVVAFLVTAPLVILLSRREVFARPALNGLGSAFRSSRRHRREADRRAAAAPRPA
ncbi:protein translocase subunit SecD, partial [Corynebacterium bovis]